MHRRKHVAQRDWTVTGSKTRSRYQHCGGRSDDYQERRQRRGGSAEDLNHSRVARASASTFTPSGFAAASFSAQTLTVLPVVTTSSIRTMRLLFKSRSLRGSREN